MASASSTSVMGPGRSTPFAQPCGEAGEAIPEAGTGRVIRSARLQDRLRNSPLQIKILNRAVVLNSRNAPWLDVEIENL
jgi:hypothetical protein